MLLKVYYLFHLLIIITTISLTTLQECMFVLVITGVCQCYAMDAARRGSNPLSLPSSLPRPQLRLLELLIRRGNSRDVTQTHLNTHCSHTLLISPSLLVLCFMVCLLLLFVPSTHGTSVSEWQKRSTRVQARVRGVLSRVDDRTRAF